MPYFYQSNIIYMPHLHLSGHQFGHVPPVVLLGVAHEGEGAVVDFDDVLAPLLVNDGLDGANGEPPEEEGHLGEEGGLQQLGWISL